MVTFAILIIYMFDDIPAYMLMYMSMKECLECAWLSEKIKYYIVCMTLFPILRVCTVVGFRFSMYTYENGIGIRF